MVGSSDFIHCNLGRDILVVERILCAAIWYKDWPVAKISPVNINSGVVMCGHRHGHIIHQHVAMMGKRAAEMGEYEQGFLTDAGRFVDREEAWIIAEKANQIIQQSGGYGTLYSEDLY